MHQDQHGSPVDGHLGIFEQNEHVIVREHCHDTDGVKTITRRLILAFRGTASAENAKTDLDSIQVTNPIAVAGRYIQDDDGCR